MGAYPRGTGSNPVEGNGHLFRSYRQLYLSSFSDTHTLKKKRQVLDLHPLTIFDALSEMIKLSFGRVLKIRLVSKP